jgi:hypothetical protein
MQAFTPNSRQADLVLMHASMLALLLMRDDHIHKAPAEIRTANVTHP